MCNTILESLKQEFKQIEGDDLAKVKGIIENHSDNWAEVDQSFVIDLLDDKNISACAIVEALQEIVEYDEVSPEFKYAVMAMDLGLKRAKRERLAVQAQAEDPSWQ